MTEIILSFPSRNRAQLSCVWIETGNPTRPLACKWIIGDLSGTVTNVAKPQSHRLCA
jgi:hypothetical protein